jgi:hypothetical protein
MRHIGCNEKLQKYFEEVNRFEQELQKRHREAMQKEMQAYLEDLDNRASQEVLLRGGYESKGKVQRTILTSMGKITIRVRCYRNKRGYRLYPLRDICGIGSETGQARKRCVRLVIERSYGWSAGVLQEEFGMEISRMRLWKIAQQEGKKAQQRLEQQRKKQYDQAQTGVEPMATVEIDGTLLASRERGVRDIYGRRRMEVKLGVMFRGRASVGRGKRRKTLKRSVYAQVTDVESFGEQWYTHCRQSGLGSQERVHVIADGASWIRTVREGHFPNSSYTLDLYHLKRKAREALLDHQAERFCALIRTGLTTSALEYLRSLRPSDDRHRELLRQFRVYVEQNRDGLRYRPGQIWGSGVVEKLVDIVVGKRMKRQGMSWSLNGANNLLALRCNHINTIAA